MPVLLSRSMTGMEHSMTGTEAILPVRLPASVISLAVLVHTLSMLAVAGVLALIFFETYEKLGLRVLQHTWLNFDLLWAIALLVAGGAVLLP